MKQELQKLADGLDEIIAEIENKIQWGDTDLSDIISELEHYAKDARNLADIAIDLDDIKAVEEYEQKAQEIVENAINKELEDNAG
jgi:DNA repair exonuclease SbcCD ATPase subunit